MTALGNQQMQQLLQRGQIRAKQEISQPDDPEEREADRLADVSVGMARPGPADTGCKGGGTPCPACSQERLSRRALSDTGRDAGLAPNGSPLGAIRGGGQPLAPSDRAYFEPRLGADIGKVRIHTGAEAAASARAIRARAYTAGRDIAFGIGEYSPQTSAGRRLLAHELAHVVQNSGNAGGIIQRQVDAGVESSGPTDAGGTGLTRQFRGETVSDDPAYTYELLQRIYLAQGYGAMEDFVNAFEYELVLPRRPAAGVSDDPEFNRDASIGATLRTQFQRLADEERAFVTEFESHAKAAATSALEESSRHIEAEAIRYGVGNLHLTFSFWWGIPEIKGDVADNASTRGIAIAAQGLLDRKSKAEQAMKRYTDFTSGATALAELASQRLHSQESEFAAYRAEIARTQRELDVYRIQIHGRYPLLAALSSDEDFKRGSLEDLAKGDKGTNAEAAQVIVDQIVEKRANIKKVQEELKPGGDVNVWLVPKLVNATRDEFGVQPGTLRDRMVNDKVTDEQPGALTGILIGILQIGLVLLAPVTGGLTLIPAAAIGVGTAYSHYREYEIQAALHGTDFGAAALSAEEPSLFWLAVDIVGAGFDVGAAAGAAVRIFRALAPAAKAAREAQATADAILKLERQAAELGGEALARQVGRDARAVGGASSEVGVTAKEAAKFEQVAADVAAEELRTGVQSAETLAGGHARVSRSGAIWSCSSPCAMMRERYQNLLAQDPNYLQRLEGLEARARQAATGPEGDALRQQIATEAAALEREMRMTPLGDWTSPLRDSPDFNELLQRRGSAAATLDHHPPGWTGQDEARFLYGDAATPEPGYRWVMDESGSLRYDRRFDNLPRRTFDPETRAFRAAEEARPAAVALETDEELTRLAAAGASATSRADWLARIRRAVPAVADVDDASLLRVMGKSPNLDHMRGELLEALAGGPLARRAASAGRGAEFVAGNRVRDAAGRQLTDGMVIRRTGPGRADVLVIGESKAGESAAEGLRLTRTRIKDMSAQELSNLEGQAIDELRARAGHADTPSNELPLDMRSDALRRSKRAEIDALMKDINTSESGQVVRDFERMMPNWGRGRDATILVDGKPLNVRVSPRSTVVAATVPTDVQLESTIAAAAESGIRVEAEAVGVSTARIEEIARQLRAEQIRNGTRF